MAVYSGESACRDKKEKGEINRRGRNGSDIDKLQFIRIKTSVDTIKSIVI